MEGFRLLDVEATEPFESKNPEARMRRPSLATLCTIWAMFGATVTELPLELALSTSGPLEVKALVASKLLLFGLCLGTTLGMRWPRRLLALTCAASALAIAPTLLSQSNTYAPVFTLLLLDCAIRTLTAAMLLRPRKSDD